jgi:hypothetical protein
VGRLWIIQKASLSVGIRARIKKHVNALDILAKDLGISADVMLSAYRCEFDRLAQQAKIRDFLSILIAREVRDIVIR